MSTRNVNATAQAYSPRRRVNWLIQAIPLCLFASQCFALPPLGFTEIGTVTRGQIFGLSFVGERAYVTIADRLIEIGAVGVIGSAFVSHPELGSPSSVAPLVEAIDGATYFAATFRDSQGGISGGALYRLENTSMPITTWNGRRIVSDVDRFVRSFGNVFNEAGEPLASRFNLDGSVTRMEGPSDYSFISDVTPNGHAIGGALIPGTLGGSVALWDPAGNFRWGVDPPGGGIGTSIRERADNRGVNYGYVIGLPAIVYGDQPPILVTRSDGTDIFGGLNVVVSQSEFAVITSSSTGTYGYYPGIVPTKAGAALDIVSVFPELAPLNDARFTVSNLWAIDRRVYMTVRSGDLLYLFGALDPSLAPVPEPWALGLACIALAASLSRRTALRRRP